MSAPGETILALLHAGDDADLVERLALLAQDYEGAAAAAREQVQILLEQRQEDATTIAALRAQLSELREELRRLRPRTAA